MSEHMPEKPLKPTTVDQQPARPNHIMMRPLDGILSGIIHAVVEHTRNPGRVMYQPEGPLLSDESE